ncbi:hypothetical protein CALCODRAFT_484126 [Calocera cornea HHB12733]|uniref:Uncharacterized protein n=1 Tax=Calocera cornea HHB12733 TaxID=1353952 RepID=A0A165F5A9_9BASI|nr:hypothetical protein CALCODRAFT_484126 [Calocera cornea HHB12733]
MSMKGATAQGEDEATEDTNEHASGAHPTKTGKAGDRKEGRGGMSKEDEQGIDVVDEMGDQEEQVYERSGRSDGDEEDELIIYAPLLVRLPADHMRMSSSSPTELDSAISATLRASSLQIDDEELYRNEVQQLVESPVPSSRFECVRNAPRRAFTLPSEHHRYLAIPKMSFKPAGIFSATSNTIHHLPPLPPAFDVPHEQAVSCPLPLDDGSPFSVASQAHLPFPANCTASLYISAEVAPQDSPLGHLAPFLAPSPQQPIATPAVTHPPPSGPSLNDPRQLYMSRFNLDDLEFWMPAAEALLQGENIDVWMGVAVGAAVRDGRLGTMYTPRDVPADLAPARALLDAPPEHTPPETASEAVWRQYNIRQDMIGLRDGLLRQWIGAIEVQRGADRGKELWRQLMYSSRRYFRSLCGRRLGRLYYQITDEMRGDFFASNVARNVYDGTAVTCRTIWRWRLWITAAVAGSY